MTRLPVTVVSGYLGAGKTTLVNRLLAEDHGVKLLVMVNDFGAINIDAALLASAEADTLTLTNGCVCCTLGGDLAMAFGDALDRCPRPDHLIIEASGIADPSRIAGAAIAEPEMSYGGVVCVVDGPTAETLLDDELIGSQVSGQVARADIVVVTKGNRPSPGLSRRLSGLTQAPVLQSDAIGELAPLFFGLHPRLPDAEPQACHPTYLSWSYEGDRAMTRDQIRQSLANRPAGLFRLKGMVRAANGGAWEVQVVGADVSVSRAEAVAATQIVAIGLKERVSVGDIETWWAGSAS